MTPLRAAALLLALRLVAHGLPLCGEDAHEIGHRGAAAGDGGAP